MQQKIVKALTSAAMVIALGLTAMNGYSNEPVGGGDDAKKKISGIDCWSGNQIVSFGSCCITGAGSCTANPCPSGTDPRSEFCGN